MGLICVTVLACPEQLSVESLCVCSDEWPLWFGSLKVSEKASENIDQIRSKSRPQIPPGMKRPITLDSHPIFYSLSTTTLFFGHVHCLYNVLSKTNVEIMCAYCRPDYISCSMNLIQCFKPQRSVQYPLVDGRKKSYNHKVLIDCYWDHTLILTRLPK